MTDLLSETMMFLCWLTDLLSHHDVINDYDDCLTDLLWDIDVIVLTLTDLSETMMFLCWLFDRPPVRHWCLCTDCLTDLLWDTDVFVLTVWQTSCETLMSLYWLFDRPVRHWCLCTDCLTDLLETMMFLCFLTDLSTETVTFLRWLFDRPAVRDCDVSPSLHAGVHGQGARGVWLLNSVAPGYRTWSAGGPPAAAQGQHVAQGHADPAASEVHLLQVRLALPCPGECLKWFWKSLFKALKRDFRTQGLYKPYLHINI